MFFHKGHTYDKHFDFIGETLDITRLGAMYNATLSGEQRERIRRDPGVSQVTQYGGAEWT